MFKKQIPLLFIAFLIYSCSLKKDTRIYIGGEIINPTDGKIILFKDHLPIDTFFLKKDNSFGGYIQNIEDGMYYFKHHPEYQYLLLEKKDSLLLRLNTLDFDESLVFSGKGAIKNNTLIELFLENEKHQNILEKSMEKKPDAFLRIANQLQYHKTEKYIDDIAKKKYSKRAKKIIHAAITYPYYTYLEKYIAKHNVKLPERFYAHRKNINTNQKGLHNFRPYLNFLEQYTHTLAIKNCDSYCKNHTPEQILHRYIDKLKTIDSIVLEPNAKENLLRRTAHYYFFKEQKPINNISFLQTYNTLAKKETYKQEVNALFKHVNALQSGKEVPKVRIITPNNSETTNLEVLENKKTVYYFWSSKQNKQLVHTHQKIQKLQKKHPEVCFIGINIDDNYKHWKNALKTYRIPEKNQYQCADFKTMSHTFLLASMNKAIVISNKQTIINGFTTIYDPRILE